MPSFADSFWTDDLTTGVEALFDRLRKGSEQNNLFIQLFASRMQFEVEYGRQLCCIRNGIDKIDTTGDSRSTLEAALEGMVVETIQEGNHHLAIATNIEATVLEPFSKWCTEHKQRIEYSEKILKNNVDSFLKSKKYVEKLEHNYFSKCRSLEDFKRSNFNEDELTHAMKSLELQRNYELNLEKEREFQKLGTFGSIDFDHKTMRETLQLLLTKLEKSTYKVPLISFIIYNTNNGSEIVKFLMEHLSLKDVDQAEAFGQDLLNYGFLKYCNGVGNTFVNSKKFQYQWKPYAYTFARVTQPNATEGNEEENGVNSGGLSNYIQDFRSKISQPSNVSPTTAVAPVISGTEKTLFKLLSEVEAADSKYHKECLKLDSLRCSVEELMVDHYAFMEKCEFDRLKALKKVTLDFCATISNKISSLKITVEGLMANESNIDPTADLLQTLEQFRTGFFQPRVIAYNNYYNPGGFQNFGIDLETRCRLDKKVVPLIVSTILSYMDHLYPELPNDNVRTTIWTVPVKLHSTHQLRKLLNTRPFSDETEIIDILKEYNSEPSTVASVLKIYLLELPEPLIFNEVYDILKALYTEFPPASSSGQFQDTEEERKEEAENEKTLGNQVEIDAQRIKGVSTTLSSLPRPHIATLDVITTHFSRLIKILKMSSFESGKTLANEFIISISQEFANCIIQVKLPDGNDLGYKIFHDLLTYKKKIFRDLKRQGSKSRVSSSDSSQ